MLESIKLAKAKLLESLKSERELVVAAQARLADAKYAEKRVTADRKCNELVVAFEKYKQEEFAKVNAAIEATKTEVENKKAAVLQAARTEADNEAHIETAAQLAEYDKEITALEKELS